MAEPAEVVEIECRRASRAVEGVLRPGWVFLVIVACPGEDGTAACFGNVSRADAADLLRRVAEKADGETWR